VRCETSLEPLEWQSHPGSDQGPHEHPHHADICKELYFE
jgi:hypothetical protein